jgi:hypothetical protein
MKLPHRRQFLHLAASAAALPHIRSASDHRERWPRLGSINCSAILGALAFNFFLTEPRYTLAVDDPANIWAIGLLFVVGLIVSGVAFTSRQRGDRGGTVKKAGDCAARLQP